MLKSKFALIAVAVFVSAALLCVGTLSANTETTWRIDSELGYQIVRGQTDLKCADGFVHASFFDSSKKFVRRELAEIIAGTFDIFFFERVDESKMHSMRLDCVY